MNKKYCVVITTTDKKETAILIAKILINSKLASCVQIDQIQSFFRQEVECTQVQEFRLFIKARSDNYKAIEESIKTHHNYQLPQVISLDIADGSSEYLNWINEFR